MYKGLFWGFEETKLSKVCPTFQKFTSSKAPEIHIQVPKQGKMSGACRVLWEARGSRGTGWSREVLPCAPDPMEH